MNNEQINQIYKEAIEDHVPIMSTEAIEYITSKLIGINATRVLELGTAIGYSSISFASKIPNLIIDTVERDEQRHLRALENIRTTKLRERIHAYWLDIYDFESEHQYDALIIDAAKAQNEAFYLRFEDYVRKGGIIFVDNMDFHGLSSQDEALEHRRNLRMMLEKIERFDQYIETRTDLNFERLAIGDGLLVIYK